MINASKAVVLLSGGQDSSYCLAWAMSHYDFVGVVSFDYGQRHANELNSAKKVCSFFHIVWHRVVTLGNILRLDTCSLFTGNTQVPDASNWYQKGIVPTTYVPFRNAILLMMAAKQAIELDWYKADLVIGVTSADYQLHPYPDCTPEFIDTIDELMVSMKSGFRVKAPLLFLTKAEQVKFGITLPNCYRAWAYSHTSYSGDYPPNPNDPAAALRANGFEQADLPDPLIVRAYLEGLLEEWPKTRNYSRFNKVKSLDELYSLIGAT